MSKEMEFGLNEIRDCLHIYGLKKLCPDVYDRILKEYRKAQGVIPYDPGYVYAIQASGTKFFKLGKTSNPDRRILQIAPQMPFPTRYVKVWRTNFMSLAERWLHDHFSRNRANGEWFNLEDHLAADIFYEFVIEYEETIRNVYGVYFFNSVFKNELLYQEIKSHFSDRSDGCFYLGLWGGSSKSIAWIDDLFREISAEEFPVAQDLIPHYKAAAFPF